MLPPFLSQMFSPLSRFPCLPYLSIPFWSTLFPWPILSLPLLKLVSWFFCPFVILSTWLIKPHPWVHPTTQRFQGDEGCWIKSHYTFMISSLSEPYIPKYHPLLVPCSGYFIAATPLWAIKTASSCLNFQGNFCFLVTEKIKAVGWELPQFVPSPITELLEFHSDLMSQWDKCSSSIWVWFFPPLCPSPWL